MSEEVLLMGPGPSPVSQRVLRALSRPLLGHLDPRFLQELDSVGDNLRLAFGSSARLTFPVSGTGSAAMEAAVVNLLWPGRTVLVLENGVFGERLTAMAQRAGAKVVRRTYPMGSPVDPEDVRQALRESGADVVAIVQAETSTGVKSDVDAVASLARERGAQLIVDTVTSLGGMPVSMDAWNAAIVYSGSQKCLGAPPGLGPISVADDALAGRPETSTVQSWYLDLGLIARYVGTERLYHHTAPVSMVFALGEALRALREEGLEERFLRHRKASAALRAGLGEFSLPSRVAPADLLPSLTVVTPPKESDEAALRRELLLAEGIEIAGGLGPWKGQAWRIGTMGEGARLGSVLRTVQAIARVLRRDGRSASPAAAAQAATSAWEETQ
ncbi:MAG: alanine--glyoxylate aminotransferase family protein [Thermaerobacter sp.]|nr:alanine--glyoxylate aminotransferase family protein [Thermaerobacter sp.]